MYKIIVFTKYKIIYSLIIYFLQNCTICFSLLYQLQFKIYDLQLFTIKIKYQKLTTPDFTQTLISNSSTLKNTTASVTDPSVSSNFQNNFQYPPHFQFHYN